MPRPRAHLDAQGIDGVMIGRAAYQTPCRHPGRCRPTKRSSAHRAAPKTRPKSVVRRHAALYRGAICARAHPCINAITRHMLGPLRRPSRVRAPGAAVLVARGATQTRRGTPQVVEERAWRNRTGRSLRERRSRTSGLGVSFRPKTRVEDSRWASDAAPHAASYAVEDPELAHWYRVTMADLVCRGQRAWRMIADGSAARWAASQLRRRLQSARQDRSAAWDQGADFGHFSGLPSAQDPERKRRGVSASGATAMRRMWTGSCPTGPTGAG